MSEHDLIDVIRGANVQIGVLYGQLISISFAMVVAIYYFLNQSRWPIKLLSFAMYLVGVGIFLGLMLVETNEKAAARIALEALPTKSQFTDILLQMQHSWVFTAASVLLNAGIWLLLASVGFLLFFWRRAGAAR
ncbi:MAG: hypothetical protein QM759_14725 [Terricaulis sp.]